VGLSVEGVSMNKKIEIKFPTNEHGLTGRECPFCGGYFKVKFGTGLRTFECICPYCGQKEQHDKFLTKAQNEYVKSVVARDVLGPELKKLEQSLRDLERSTRGGFLQIKMTTSGFDFPLKCYKERDLETHITCDSCGLEFAIYGVFANCPDCERLNALTILGKSIEVAGKKIRFLDSLDPSDSELKEAVLADALSGGVSSFDGFGKALRARYPEVFSEQQRNLFQNLSLLSSCLERSIGRSLPALIGDKEFRFLVRWFQVRHIYEHNMGVVDEDFVKKVEDSYHLKGKKYPLAKQEIEKFLVAVKSASEQIMAMLPGQQKS
jgi:hypothetical protein